MLYRATKPRSGTVIVEAAIVYPLTFLLVLGLLVGGLGMFRFQEVASLAREATRWACVHGSVWATQQNSGTLTRASDVYTNAIQPRLLILNPANLNYTVTWSNDSQAPGCTITVTVTYSWMPEVYAASASTMTSTSTLTVAY